MEMNGTWEGTATEIQQELRELQKLLEEMRRELGDWFGGSE